MKRKLFFPFFFLILFVFFQISIADGVPVSVNDLSSIENIQWKEVYQAYGRNIAVDVNVYIPNVDAMPVIKAVKMPPISEPLNRELTEQYQKADKKDKVYSYKFESNDYWTYIEHACPPQYGKTKKDDNFKPGAMGTHIFDLFDYEYDQAYADNNPLTVRDAIQIAQNHLHDFFPDISAKVESIWIQGETYWKKNHKTIKKQGSYVINMRQELHGIPIMAEIRNAYSDQINWEINWESDLAGTICAYIYNDDSWLLACRPYQESGVIINDIPVLPFDCVKETLEQLILSGHIRLIHSVSLGYVQFETVTPAEQILLPCWVAWCEYHSDGPASEPEYGINDSGIMFDQNNPYFRPIIINAQTGMLFDPETSTQTDCLCPDLSLWQ